MPCYGGLASCASAREFAVRHLTTTIPVYYSDMRSMLTRWGGPIPGKPAVQGWYCSDCPWSEDMLGMYRPAELVAWERRARKSFEKHNCIELRAAAARAEQGR